MSSRVNEHPGQVRVTVDPAGAMHARRIGRAWIELRRGALVAALRSYLYGHENVLEQGQMDTLDLVVRRDRTMSGLAERLRVDPSTATRAAQRLVDEGLAERIASPDDGRVVLVRATDAGRELHRAVAARRTDAMERILSAFSPDERAQLADLLDRFVDSLDDVVSGLGGSPEPGREQTAEQARDPEVEPPAPRADGR